MEPPTGEVMSENELSLPPSMGLLSSASEEELRCSLRSSAQLPRALMPWLIAVSVACSSTPPPPPPAPPPPPVTPASEPVEEPTPSPALAGEGLADAAARAESDRQLAEAEVLFRSGDLEGHQLQAIEELLRQVTGRNPELPEGHYNLGVLYERTGEPQRARAQYQAALQAEPGFTPAVTALVYFALRRGDESGALMRVEEALRQRAADLSLQNLRSRVLLATPGNSSRVIRETKLVLRQDQRNVEAMVHLATAYAQEGKHELARSILENALKITPRHLEASARLAESLIALEFPRDAQEVLEAAIEQGGGAEVHNQLGLVYHRAGNYAAAAAQFRAALSYWPGMHAAHLNLGNALRGDRRYQESAQIYQELIAANPSDFDAHYSLGVLYLDIQVEGQTKIELLQQAIQFLEQAIALEGEATIKERARGFIADAQQKITNEEARAAQAAEAAAEQAAFEAEQAAFEAEQAALEGGSEDGEGGDGEGAEDEALDEAEAPDEAEEEPGEPSDPEEAPEAPAPEELGDPAAPPPAPPPAPAAPPGDDGVEVLEEGDDDER